MEGDLVEKAVGQPSERAYQRCCRGSSICPTSHQRKWLYYKLFPNVAFDIYPDQVDFMQFLPVSATETVIREISYALPDDRREMKAARYLNWRINRRVNAEDTELITRVQLGMQSPSYEAGPLGTSEVCLRQLREQAQGLIPQARFDRPPPPAGPPPLPEREDRDSDGKEAQRQQEGFETGAVESEKDEGEADDAGDRRPAIPVLDCSRNGCRRIEVQHRVGAQAG